MKISEFWEVMGHEFGANYSQVLARDLVLSDCGNITAEEALAKGEDVRRVWLAICDIQEIPEERRWGPDKKPKD